LVVTPDFVEAVLRLGTIGTVMFAGVLAAFILCGVILL